MWHARPRAREGYGAASGEWQVPVRPSSRQELREAGVQESGVEFTPPMPLFFEEKSLQPLPTARLFF
jgi:hypothetical protein